MRRTWMLLVLWRCGLSPEIDHAPARGAEPRLSIDPAIARGVERARGVTAARALELAAEDALLARELEQRDPELARYARSVALARALLEALAQDTREQQPVTDADIEALTAERWWTLDRPRMVRVIHALVRSDSASEPARQLAERVRTAVLDAKDAAAFKRAAESVETGGLALKVETLPPLAADGRSVDLDRPPPEGPPVRNMAAAFADAAARLERPGEISPVVHTMFGYHVIRLLEVIEPSRPPLAERRPLLEPEIVGQRARARTQELLERLRAELAPEQERAALSAMELVRSAP